MEHNPNNGVTADVWSDNGVVHKVLTCRKEAPANWASSLDQRHWNYWKREALAYEYELPARLGLSAPKPLGISETADGDIELLLEQVTGRHAAALTLEDLDAVAMALGLSQGRRQLPDEPWLSRDFIRSYSGSRVTDWSLLGDDAAWEQPLIRQHFGPELRAALGRLHERREWLLSLMERLPRTVCHLDVWPNNVIRADGEPVLLDWAFVGDGAIGEDIGNLIPDSVFDLAFRHSMLDLLDDRLTSAYLEGLRAVGWDGDERLVRLGKCASAVKYDWLTVYCLENASRATQMAYGHTRPVDVHARYAARAAGLAHCAWWADEAEKLVQEAAV